MSDKTVDRMKLPIRRPPFTGIARTRRPVALVTVDPDGTIAVKETGDHLGRKGLEIGGGVGLAVGLLAPPLPAATVVGGVIGKFTRHKVESGLEENMGAALPPGSEGIVAIYDRAKTDTVNTTLAAAVKNQSPRSTAAVPKSSRPRSPRHKPVWEVDRRTPSGRWPGAM